MPESRLFRILSAGLLLFPLYGRAPTGAELCALDALRDLKPSLGLDQRSTFAVRRSTPDSLLGGVDVRVDQYFLGIRVMGGEAILHIRDGRVRSITDGLVRHFSPDINPTLTANEALAVAVADLAPRGPFAQPPGCELVMVRMRLGPGTPALRSALVYHIHTALENGTRETAHTDYLIDAHTGAVAKRWDSLETAAATGQGESQYSGTVAINTISTKAGFELRDLTRGRGGNTVVNLDHGTADDAGAVFTAAADRWGDGQNYDGGATASRNGETAGVDAAYGLQWTWDYYKNIHHRDGIDGLGRGTTLRVHYDTGYDNAFWSDDCFCMTFGDGTRFKSLEAIDVMGHEMSHGVCSTTAGLEYFGESGGLNESNSDINGTMVEFYARGGSAGRIGEVGGNWTMGEQLETPDHPTPIRYLYKPSKDGKSPDAWYPEIQDLNVHHSSGPMNRCFFFLSQGASPDKASDFYTSYLTKGMAGIGNDKAARIWFRALTTYMTSGADYAEARKDTIAAARDIHGAGSPEEAAVWNAFHGINVGDPWPKASKPKVTAAR
jgi:Zn-dependent metalloprotease